MRLGLYHCTSCAAHPMRLGCIIAHHMIRLVLHRISHRTLIHRDIFNSARDVSDGTASAAAFGNAPSKAPRKVSRSSGSRAVGGTRETPKATSDAEAATKPGATKDKLAGVESKYLDKGCRHGEQEGAASDPVPLHSDLDPDPDSESDPDPDPNPTPNSDSQPNPDTNHNPTTQSVNPEIEMDALRFRQILKPKKPKPKH
eukprot:98347-Amorphochlora_amoeboformis.AAC.1